MTKIEQMAEFVERASYEDLSESVIRQIKIRILDSLGCAIGALNGEPVCMIRKHIQNFGGNELCTMIGGGKTSPDRAAFYNSALVRYLDFNDSYLAKDETCHPSDNLGAVLASVEYACCSGRDFITALFVAYQIQCRLSDVAPVRAKGFDHTTQGSYAVAAGVSKALGLNQEQTANALAISGTAFNALRVTRTGRLSHWKGLAYPNTAFCGVHASFLAMEGITGPIEVIEGNKGFMDSISGKFEIDWTKEDREDMERVTRTIIKKYNAEIHSQSAIEGAIELKEELKKEHNLSCGDIERIEVDIFDVAFNIIGGGEEGDKTIVSNKEDADHSLPYMLAVALLDGQVMPEQYLPERIQGRDAQELLRRVFVRPCADYSKRFPGEMPCLLKVILHNGKILTIEKRDYEGFHTRPVKWEDSVRKFDHLSRHNTDASLRKEIISAVAAMEGIMTVDLTGLLAKVHIYKEG